MNAATENAIRRARAELDAQRRQSIAGEAIGFHAAETDSAEKVTGPRDRDDMVAVLVGNSGVPEYMDEAAYRRVMEYAEKAGLRVERLEGNDPGPSVPVPETAFTVNTPQNVEQTRRGFHGPDARWSRWYDANGALIDELPGNFTRRHVNALRVRELRTERKDGQR